MLRLPRWATTGQAIDTAWLVFAFANLAAMWWLIQSTAPSGIETVPFHFVYVSFTILYGFRTWRTAGVLAGITFVALSTGLLTLMAIDANREDWAELTEVPLMTLMFLAMVFHVHHRQQAVATAGRLAAELRANLARQRAFVSDASHELLTPITIARGHLELLGRRAAWSPDEATEARSIVVAELDRMERVIDRLLLLEALSAAGGIDPETIELSEFGQELFHRWEHAAPRRWRLDARAPGTAALDRDRMTVAMDALLENAVRHTQPEGIITLSIRRHDDRVELGVCDDGDGIPAEAHDRIFDRFYRIQPGRSRRTGGAGLGLSIVRAVVEAHAGTISVSSAPGRGTCFVIDLPGSSAAGDQPVATTANGLDPHARLELAP